MEGTDEGPHIKTPVAESSLPLTRLEPPDLLLVVFIHGFKGTDTTFSDFPQRLQHVLSESIDRVIVESIVFPAYETKGDLNVAVERFADWLATLTVERENAHGEGSGAGKAKIVLCGHSMGGLLAADTLLEIARSRPDPKAPLWPRILACIAFDTPYLGLHPFVFKNSATKAAEYAGAARTIASDIMSLTGFGAKTSGTSTPPLKPPVAAITAPPAKDSVWGKWAPAAYAVGGAVLAGAAAGTAYYKREDLGLGYTWATDHMRYVKNLWDEEALRRRVDELIDLEEELGVVFRTFYTFLPPSPPSHLQTRTFIVLPARSSRSKSRFLPARNGIAPDELQAHTGMFAANTNDGYYELGLTTARLIREAVMTGRGIGENSETEAKNDDVAGQAMSETLHKEEEAHSEDLIDL